jgi:hypothetical protein
LQNKNQEILILGKRAQNYNMIKLNSKGFFAELANCGCKISAFSRASQPTVTK